MPMLPMLADHPLCPCQAVHRMQDMLGPRPPKAQAFPMKGALFNKRLRSLTSALPGNFSSHSLRRGGATYALAAGVPWEVVKLMGDWASTCYLQYFDQIPNNIIEKYRNRFAKTLPSH